MLREIAARLGVQIDDKELLSFMGVLDSAKGKLLAFGGAFLGAMSADFIIKQVEAADAIGDTAERLGITTDELQQFQYAMKLTGADVEGAERALFIFNKTVGEAATGTGDATKKFSALGVKFKDANGHIRPALDLLPDVADKVAEAGSQAEKTAIATNFFGKAGKDLIPLLNRGAEGVQELKKEFEDLGGGVSSEVIAGAGATADQLDRLSFTTKALAMNAIGALLPMLTKLVGWLLKGAAAIQALLKNTEIAKTALVALGVIGAIKFIPMILSMIQAFTALRTVVFGVSMPFWLVFAAVAAMYLIFDDLFTLMNGGESLIGNLADKLWGVGTSEKIVAKLKSAWATLKDLWADTKTVFVDLWASVKPILQAMWDFIVPIFNKTAELLGMKARLGGEEKTKTFSTANGNDLEAEKLLHPDQVLGKAGIVKNPLAALGGGNTDQLALSQSPLYNAMMAGMPKPSGPSNVTQTISAPVTVTVPPGTPPAAIPGAITSGVSDGLKRSLQDAYNGVSTKAVK